MQIAVLGKEKMGGLNTMTTPLLVDNLTSNYYTFNVRIIRLFVCVCGMIGGELRFMGRILGIQNQSVNVRGCLKQVKWLLWSRMKEITTEEKER